MCSPPPPPPQYFFLTYLAQNNYTEAWLEWTLTLKVRLLTKPEVRLCWRRHHDSGRRGERGIKEWDGGSECLRGGGGPELKDLPAGTVRTSRLEHRAALVCLSVVIRLSLKYNTFTRNHTSALCCVAANIAVTTQRLKVSDAVSGINGLFGLVGDGRRL